MLSTLKALLASVLCQAWIGRLLRTVFGAQLPSLRFRGLRIDVRTPAVAPQTVAQIFWGIYESAELRFVERHLRSDLDVVELGASLGVVSSAIARRLQPGRRLVCLEANPDLVDSIRANVGANAPGVRIDVLNGALAYGSDSVGFVTGATNIAGHLGGAADAEAGQRRVPALGLGELLRRESIERYALVCDIEGAEAALLHEDAAALAGCEQILIELHQTEYRGRRLAVEDLLARLRDELDFDVVEGIGPVYALLRRAG